jgi:hypothetical protein
LELTGSLPNQATFLVPVSHGDYLVEILDPSGCSVPDKKLYLINQKFEVKFSVPAVVQGCVSYAFTASGPKPLN